MNGKKRVFLAVLIVSFAAILFCACGDGQHTVKGTVSRVNEYSVEVVKNKSKKAAANPLIVPRDLFGEVKEGEKASVTYEVINGRNHYLTAAVLKHEYKYDGPVFVEKVVANRSSSETKTYDKLYIIEVYEDCFLAASYKTRKANIRVNLNGKTSKLIVSGQEVKVTLGGIYRNERYTEGALYSIEKYKKKHLKYPYNIKAAKPVIYLYPEKEQEVSVQLSGARLTCTYPKYEEGWKVLARPDGTLLMDGKEYNYLYWEGISDLQCDYSEGFCIKGSDTAAFLEEKLAALGLNRKEANEFIVYWLPLMEKNAYNIISFQGENYCQAAELTVTPAPDTVIRVFMSWHPSETPVELPAQELSVPERKGFTVVEWGGTQD